MSTESKNVLGSVTEADLSKYSESLDNDKFRLAQNTLAHTSIKKACLVNKEAIKVDNIYSHKIPKEQKVTSQKASGRCWLFAATNAIRHCFIAKHKLETFEFSQSHLVFWDKFEKANYFLESIIRTADKPTDDRLIAYLLTSPVNDGGQYDMFRNIVKKHGLIPQSCFPETKSSSATRELNWIVTRKLREFAAELRAAHRDGETHEQLRSTKNGMVQTIYRIMCAALGEPPKTFDWRFVNKDKEYQCFANLTPLSFVEQHVPFDVDDYVSLVHDPRNEPGQLYTVDFLGNVVGGDPVLYVNCELNQMKQLAADHIAKAKEPVWFGCDVGKFCDRDLGAMNLALFDYENVFDIEFTLNKADRLRYGESLMTHAMVFTGVDLDADGNVNKWRVENSWGDKSGDKGYYSMTDAWFDEYNYQIVLPKSALPKAMLDVFAQTPKVLPAWDPMGSLAL